MLDKIIEKRLQKEGFIKVPKSWAEDFKELVEKNRVLNRTVREIAREYDNLLRELAEGKSASWLKKELKEVGIEVEKQQSKEELVESYLNTFQINFDDDTDEEVE